MSAEKRWVTKPQGDSMTVETLAASLNIPKVLANLLVQRGITTHSKAWEFFNPKLETLHDPFLMKDMESAVKRIEQAVSTGEKIMVYGDYDVDGTTAVALVYRFIKSLGGAQVSFYIPDRYTEGYGVSIKAIDYAQRKGISLIITLDCGIKAVEKVDYANELGIDFIICDHHLPGETVPQAKAVLNPKQVDCPYPFKELSGCGVGFKLVQGYCQYKNIPFSEITGLLDLVAVSIAADIVPVVGENRVLAYYGLRCLNERPSKGLQSILRICGLDNMKVTLDDIVFKIGPRINAAGRMAVDAEQENAAPSGGHTAVYLMVAEDDSIATKFGAFIDTCNQDRKNIDRSITIEAHNYIESHPEIKSHKCTVVYNPNWMKGVVGIVASRLIETYYKPTVVLTMSNGLVTGSARSIAGFDLYQAVESCSDLLENFGGHMYAAGLTMLPENVEAFTKRFCEYVDANISDETLIQQVDIDSEILFSDITDSFRSTLARFQPFGPGNSSPLFISCKVSNGGDAKLVGAELEHLRMDLIQRQKPNTSIASIAFQQPGNFEYIRAGRPIDVCYHIVENHYRGKVTPQLRIKDIRKSDMK
ncbi:MAG: single-stranded-DNA-specific exonuclease RecJ [Rikenellaceae bacterium]